MDKNNKIKADGIDRREFLKRLGLGTVVTSLALAGCSRGAKNPLADSLEASPEVPTDRLTYTPPRQRATACRCWATA